MDKPVRVLIAEQNRYHATLIDREIHKRIGSCVTVVIHSAGKALEEIRQNSYSILIVDSLINTDRNASLLKAVRGFRPTIPIILTLPMGQIQPGIPATDNDYTALVLKDATYHIVIPQLIENALTIGSFSYNGRPFKPRLSARRKADMINITANTLAHEINNPLMTILGMSELLLGGAVQDCDASVRDKLVVIQESARRIEEALNQLGNLSAPALRDTPAGSLIKTDSAKN
ncbi:MAG: hypothetical protein JSU65_10675 [Candidatus Zixiibacteriota bacterium]|nr:MAG: hypothetical protein JSU65_10675 [candidate division Zixibacteria bacterium]